MISRVLLLVPSFTKKEVLKNFRIFFNNTQHFTHCVLYCKFRLAQLCRVFADPVTYVNECKSHVCFLFSEYGGRHEIGLLDFRVDFMPLIYARDSGCTILTIPVNCLWC